MIIAPGSNAATPEQAKTLRKQAWKRPAKKADRDKLRKDRIATAREAMGHVSDSPGISG